MQPVPRTVNKTFSDVRLFNRYYKVDPKLRGDRVEVRFDPFKTLDLVQIYSRRDESFLGQGTLHHRQTAEQTPPSPNHGPKHNYLELLINEHDQNLNQQVQGIDYTRLRQARSWPFQAFVKKLALLMGKKGGLTGFLSVELETLKKFFDRHSQISETRLVQAYQKAQDKTIPYILYELQQLSKEQ